MGRYNAKREIEPSLISKIGNTVILLVIVFLIIVSLFGSWDEWIAELIENIPFGEPITFGISKIITSAAKYTSGGLSLTFGEFLKNIISLVISTMILAVLKDKPGKHEGKATVSYWIWSKIAVPVIVAFVSAWIVSKIYYYAISAGGIFTVIGGIFGVLGVALLAIGAYGLLSKRGVLWGIWYVLAIIAKGFLSTTCSYCIVIVFMIAIGDSSLWAQAGPLLIMLLGLLIMVGVVFSNSGILNNKVVETVDDDSKFRFL